MTNLPTFYSPSGAHTSDTTISVAQTLTIPTGTSWVLIQALGANIRMTLDGTTPTASVGFQIKNGNPPLRIPVGTGMTIKVIQESSGGIVEYQCLG